MNGCRKYLKVVLVDDHELFRKGVVSLLSQCEGIEVVGEASRGQEALQLASRLRPDILLLDLRLPGLVGTEVARRVRSDYPDIKIIILSMHADAMHIAHCLSLGVSGYLLKSSSAQELEVAILTAAAGGTFLSPGISMGAVELHLEQANPGEDALGVLTNRQREVLQLLAEGLSTKKIAGSLNLSVKTVESHRTNIMDRLGIRDLAGLVRLAIRAGLVGTAE